jgi:hypothetical protein
LDTSNEKGVHYRDHENNKELGYSGGGGGASDCCLRLLCGSRLTPTFVFTPAQNKIETERSPRATRKFCFVRQLSSQTTMDLLSLVAASRPNLETNGAATTTAAPAADVARRNVWGGPDVDVPAEGPSLRQTELFCDSSIGSDDHEEEPEPSEEDSSNAGELDSGADVPNDAGEHGQEEKDDDEPTDRPKRVPRSWLTTTQDGEQQQDKRAKPYKPVLEDYVLDIPFNDYAFYPGTLFYLDEGICFIVSQHPVHFLLVS